MTRHASTERRKSWREARNRVPVHASFAVSRTSRTLLLAFGVFRDPGHDARREEVMHMQKWMRSGLLSVGLAGAMVGGGAMVARGDQRQLQLVLGLGQQLDDDRQRELVDDRPRPGNGPGGGSPGELPQHVGTATPARSPETRRGLRCVSFSSGSGHGHATGGTRSRDERRAHSWGCWWSTATGSRSRWCRGPTRSRCSTTWRVPGRPRILMVASTALRPTSAIRSRTGCACRSTTATSRSAPAGWRGSRSRGVPPTTASGGRRAPRRAGAAPEMAR